METNLNEIISFEERAETNQNLNQLVWAVQCKSSF